jgi:hypothetical protein
MGTVQVHTARKWHPCVGWKCPVGVLVGTRYRREVVFPGEEGHEDGTRPVVFATCSRCVNRELEFLRAEYGVPAELGMRITASGHGAVIFGAAETYLAVIFTATGTGGFVDARREITYHTPDGDVTPANTASTTCARCGQSRRTGSICCSSHVKSLCHGCYRRSHLVELCAEGCVPCAEEGLPALMR